MNNPDAPELLDPVSQCIAELASGACFIYILHDLVGWAASAYHHETRMKPAPKEPVSMLDCLRDQPMLGVEQQPPWPAKDKVADTLQLELISRSADQIKRYSEMLPHKRFMFVSGKETLLG